MGRTSACTTTLAGGSGAVTPSPIALRGVMRTHPGARTHARQHRIRPLEKMCHRAHRLPQSPDFCPGPKFASKDDGVQGRVRPNNRTILNKFLNHLLYWISSPNSLTSQGSQKAKFYMSEMDSLCPRTHFSEIRKAQRNIFFSNRSRFHPHQHPAASLAKRSCMVWR